MQVLVLSLSCHVVYLVSTVRVIVPKHVTHTGNLMVTEYLLAYRHALIS